MQKVYKYHLRLDDETQIDMPRGAQVLHVAEQNGSLCLWALVETHQDMGRRFFAVRGTGHDCEGLGPHGYIGTVHTMGGRLVWHVFERVVS